MKKKAGVGLLAVLLALLFACIAQATQTPDMTEVQVTIICTGRTQDKEAERDLHFEAQIQSGDGSFSQTLSYAASISLDSSKFAALEDVNFDGHPDLMLTVGLGANEYCIMALWNDEKGCFDEPYQELELCNYTLYPHEKRIGCYEKDGAAYYTQSMYRWEGTTADSLTLVAQGGTYNTGDPDTIGERVSLRDSGRWVDWDMQYDHAWYAKERVFTERYRVVALGVSDGFFAEDAKSARVANVEWVNLRKQDSKSSVSLAKLNKGTLVRVLATDCGADKNWTRVMMELPEEDGAIPVITGYIMSKYLKME